MPKCWNRVEKQIEMKMPKESRKAITVLGVT
jgi:hypothetical protein